MRLRSRALRARFFLPRLAIAVALLGCAPSTFVVQGYKGRARPPETLSILRVNGADSVQLLQVDAEPADVPVSRDARLHIELLPGEHEIVLFNAGGNASFADPVSFVAEPRRVYRPGFARLGGPDAVPEARVYEVDLASDAVRRDVSKRSRRPQPLEPELVPLETPAPGAANTAR